MPLACLINNLPSGCYMPEACPYKISLYMADNYLEKRMDELRSGRLSTSGRTCAPSRKGLAQFSFPEKRVLVVGGADGVGLSIVKEYLRAGCRVAVFDSDEEKGNELALKDGIRFHHTNLSDPDSTALQISALLKAWRDIDIVVCTLPETCNVIAMEWEEHKRKFPIPSEYGGRLITVGFTDEYAKSRMKTYGIVTSAVVPHPLDDSTYVECARGCILLSLPTSVHPCRLEIGE